MPWDVVIVGYRLNAKEPAAKALERILGLEPDAARKLARAFPAVVLAEASQQAAEQLADTLEGAGALVEVRASGAEAAATRAPASPVAGTAGAAASPARPAPSGPGAAPAKSGAGGSGRPSVPASEPPTGARAILGAPPASAAGAATSATGTWVAHGGPSAPARAAPTAAPASAAAAPAASYALGDFGLAARPRRESATLPALGSDPAPAAAATKQDAAPASTPAAAEAASKQDAAQVGALDLDLGLDLSAGGDLAASSGLPLELEHAGGGEALELDRGPLGAPADNENQLLGARFEDATAPVRAPAIDPPTHRAVQRPVRAPQSPAPGRPTRTRSAAVEALRGWLGALIMLVVLAGASALAVGYALDPGDPIGALRDDSAEPSAAEPRESGGLHPLLRATPAEARPPLAAILRARIAGVHDVPVHFAESGATVQCLLVEHAEGETQARLDRLRETGRVVMPPARTRAELVEHERALRAATGKRTVVFTPVCLAL